MPVFSETHLKIENLYVFKSCRLFVSFTGFMMEMASWDGGISRTVQFLVPKVSEDCTVIQITVSQPESHKQMK